MPLQVISALHDNALQDKITDSSIKHIRPAALFFNVCWRTVDNIVAELPEKRSVNEFFSPNTYADEVQLLPAALFFFLFHFKEETMADAPCLGLLLPSIHFQPMHQKQNRQLSRPQRSSHFRTDALL